jgi:glycosyltransferase involved in cell wall biosynthesis
MLVSVVIPAYNAEHWVAETIASVLRQSYPELEIVLVDDGSTDNTAEAACRALHGSRFPYRILSQANAGAAGARNLGRREARGQWIQFLDADDLLKPNKVSLQVAVVQRESLSDVVYSDWQKLIWVDGLWTETDLRRPVIHAEAMADILSDRNFLQLGCLLFRAETIEKAGGFDAAHEPIEDVALCIKIAIAGGVYAYAPSDGPVSSYRDVPRSFSKISRRRFLDSCVKNGKLAEQYVLRDPVKHERTIDAIADLYSAAARSFADFDHARFQELISSIEALRPNYLPKGPRQLRVLSRLTGYRRAERFAMLYRKSKSFGASLWRGQHSVQP